MKLKPVTISDYDLAIINNSLKDHYGMDSITGLPIWRVSWSDDQFEKRFGTFEDRTANGLYIRTVTEVREVRKYQYIQQRYILERLVIVPEHQVEELAGAKLSYEPIYTFESKHGYLPPNFEVAEIVIDTIYIAQYGPKNSALKDKWLAEDPDKNPEAAKEAKKKRIEALVDYFWGDSSGLGGTTISGESIIVPNSYEKRN